MSAVRHQFSNNKPKFLIVDKVALRCAEIFHSNWLWLTTSSENRGKSESVARAKVADTRGKLRTQPSVWRTSAVLDYLTTLPIVDEDRVGLLGVCAGGSYVMAVAPTELRAKAVASVSLWDLRVTAREGWPAPQFGCCSRTR